METQYGSDLRKLKKILKNQEMQKDRIRNDIRTLSLKSRNLAPIEIKLKTDKEKRKKSLKLNEMEKDTDYRNTCLMDSAEVNDSSFSGIDDSEYYKKIIAVSVILEVHTI